MDQVEKGLLWQHGMVTNFAEKIKRSITHLDAEINHLEQVRLKLESDLRDKVRFGQGLGIWGTGVLMDRINLQQSLEISSGPLTWSKCASCPTQTSGPRCAFRQGLRIDFLAGFGI